MSSVTHLTEVGSTNDWLLARAQALPDGHWVITDRQTAGRGRRGRVWNDGAGNFMGSVLVKALGQVQQLSFVAALALHDALTHITSARRGEVDSDEARRERGGANPTPGSATPSLDLSPAGRGERFTLKWPNDVLLDGTKCSGILLERQGEALVIGIGINLAHYPTSTERPATSLAAAGLAVPTPAAVLDELAAAFAHWRETWATYGFAPIRAAWLARASGVGGRIVARLGSESPQGLFTGLADDGALLMQLDDGSTRAIHAGEVFALLWGY
ncbi:biotin--[acetyl-CoA-carboxylase] ligase [Sandarakinorhabdus sp. AAP62]|uniref:biotin--[acetyl-CoA-carboxylase] ligase n=1 Tax=Sandarakinorhabdus sp. AAP62 TaxID=1248916 RepID=UPI00030B82C0|nr:biotin--[acetyl-CoA-carboxylase] ligase [Sandarakinorhabdus sp. AAP62]